MAHRLSVCIHGGNVRTRFLRGLASTQVRAKVENMLYLLPDTFDALEAAAAHHERQIRRDKPAKLYSVADNPELSSRRIGREVVTQADLQRLLEDNKKSLESSMQKLMFDFKQEMASQKQTVAKMQLECK